MNRLVFIIAFVFVFLLVTAMALTVDNPNLGRRVKFTNVSFAIRNSNNEVVNVTKNTSTTSTVKYTQKHTTSPDVTTQTDTQKYTTQNEINNYRTEYETSNNTYKNSYKNTNDISYDRAYKDASRKINSKRDYGDYTNKYSKLADGDDEDEYLYKNIDWSKWKSNFVNRILDDSLYIGELDNYPNGAFFYYSFTVDSSGGISNISVRSVYLSEHDKNLVKNLIKGYAHKPITKFPLNTNRKTAKVSAIMMLSNNETNYSKPSDFNDTERVKYKR